MPTKLGRTRCAAALLWPMVLLGGCITARFDNPVASFRESINTSGAAIATYYTGLNRFEREVYLDGRLYDPNEVVLATDAQGKPTPLTGALFSAQSIKARTDAIALLGVYAQRLGELSGSEAPKQFAEGTKVLGEDLANLQKTFEDLGDASAMDYAAPIGKIVGAIGCMVLEHKREAAVKAAIEEGAPSVRQVLAFLQKDLSRVIDPLKKTGLKQKLAERVVYYNTHRSASFEQRKQMLAEIDIAASRYEAAVTANPANLIQVMSEAHEALVKYAASPKTPGTFAELLAALQTFKSCAQEVAEAVKQIQDLRKGD
jgi:hypothetical protein